MRRAGNQASGLILQDSQAVRKEKRSCAVHVNDFIHSLL